MVEVDNCDSHGIAILGGDHTSRTSLSRPGQMSLETCSGVNCGGHGLLVGMLDEDSVDDTPYRIHINNFEAFNNASNAATRLGLWDMVLSGENIRLGRFGGKRYCGSWWPRRHHTARSSGPQYRSQELPLYPRHPCCDGYSRTPVV
jgi:hypothetical protein